MQVATMHASSLVQPRLAQGSHWRGHEMQRNSGVGGRRAAPNLQGIWAGGDGSWCCSVQQFGSTYSCSNSTRGCVGSSSPSSLCFECNTWCCPTVALDRLGSS